MTRRVLVACIGNVFFGDDGFGVEVARRLLEGPAPPGVVVADFGIRGLHLAYALLDPYDLAIVVDAVQRGGAPGTLYLLDADGVEDPEGAACAGAHGMSLPAVLAAARAMGGALPRLLLIGCEPERVDEGMGLSDRVGRAVDAAIALVRDVLADELRRARREEVEP